MKKFISIILSVSLTIMIPITILFFCTGSYLNQSSIKKVVKNIDKEVFLNELDVELLSENGKNNELVEALNKSGFMQEVIAIGLGRLGEYIQTGKDEELITKEEYYALIDKYIDDIMKETGREGKEEKEQIKNTLQNQYTEIKQNIPKVSEITKEESVSFIEPLRYICNPSIRYLLLGITLFILVILILLQRKRWNFILYTSIPAFISGIVITSIAYLFEMIIKEIAKQENESFKTLIETLFIGYSDKIKMKGFIILLLSFISIISFIIIRKKEKKNCFEKPKEM